MHTSVGILYYTTYKHYPISLMSIHYIFTFLVAVGVGATIGRVVGLFALFIDRKLFHFLQPETGPYYSSIVFATTDTDEETVLFPDSTSAIEDIPPAIVGEQMPEDIIIKPELLDSGSTDLVAKVQKIEVPRKEKVDLNIYKGTDHDPWVDYPVSAQQQVVPAAADNPGGAKFSDVQANEHNIKNELKLSSKLGSKFRTLAKKRRTTRFEKM